MLQRYGLKLNGIKRICSDSRKGLYFQLWYNESKGIIQPVYDGASIHPFAEALLDASGYHYCGGVYRSMTMQEIANQIYQWILQTRIF